MMPRLFFTIVAFGAWAAPAQPGGFQKLPFENGKGASFEQYSLRLADPDNPDKPSLWQGPLTIAAGTASCTADISLVTALYAAPGRTVLIVLSTSGSNAIAHFIRLDSCTAKWPPIKRAAGTVKVAGFHLTFTPACEGGGSNAPALCTSARVYSIRTDAPPVYLKAASYKQTEKDLGVGFTGEARVMNPHSPRAILVH